MIIKYKLVNGEVPKNITNGGYFENEGFLYGKGFETFQEVIDEETFRKEVLLMHEKNPFKKDLDNELIEMTLEEVNEIINEWIKTTEENK